MPGCGVFNLRPRPLIQTEYLSLLYELIVVRVDVNRAVDCFTYTKSYVLIAGILKDIRREVNLIAADDSVIRVSLNINANNQTITFLT